MAEQEHPRYLLFKLLLVVGGVLGLLLLFQSIGSYLYVSERVVEESLYRETARHVSYILQQSREADVHSPGELQPVLDSILEERRSDIAWLRLVDARGEEIAVSGPAPQSEKFAEAEIRGMIESDRRVLKVLDIPDGRIFVALRPFRFGFRPPPREPAQDSVQEPFGPPESRGGGRSRGGPRFLEIGIHWNSVEPVFGPLRRYMIVSVSAAIALLAAMTFIGLRFGNYLRGKQLEQQMELARTVQQDLLPKSPPSDGQLDVSAICDPAWQVGGDFYDVFHSSGDCVTLILGDVSGKGLPAALLMGMLHGAVRSTSLDANGIGLQDATRRLNELIRARTAVERFVTMFWCSYVPRDGMLHYVNAGHLAPCVVHRNEDGGVELHRLVEGGPVLGVIPEASYEQGDVPFQPGDLFVLYSDGVVEALNNRGEEFGEERIEAVLRANIGRSATDIRDAILAEVRQFSGGEPQQDDLTLLVVRSSAAVETGRDPAEAELLAV